MYKAPIALQLYSLRKAYGENPLKTMKTVKEFGYDGVEFYGNSFTPEFYAALLKESGLVCAGWHTGIDALEGEQFMKTVQLNLAVGNRFICVPWFKSEKLDDWKLLADRLNAAAEKLAPFGMFTGYHCHAHEFTPVEGVLPWDVIAQNTDPHVILQLDTGNCASGNADPLAFLTKYPGRNKSVHLKPFSKADGFNPAIGADDLPWKSLLDYCRAEGRTEWFVVEYEPEADPFGKVEQSIQFLKTL